MSEVFEKAVAELNLDRSDWQLVKFGDVAIQQKQSVDRENTELTKYVKGEHMYSEDIHLREWGELKDEYLGPAFIRKFEQGDILYGSRRTYLRKVVIAPFEGITSNTTFVIKANEERIDKRLLPFLMLSEGFSQHSIKNSKGSVNPYVNWKDLSNYEFLLPPLEKQTDIVQLFCKIDLLKESEQQSHERLKELKFAYQRQYFDITNHNYVSLEEAAKIYSGGTPSRKNNDYWGGDIPWVKTGEVNYAQITATEESITDLGLNKSAAKLIPTNSVLVAMYGQGVTRGRVALTGVPVSCNQACGVIEPYSTYLPEYIYYYLEYKYEELRALAHGANQQNLNLKMIKEFQLPDFDEITQKELVNHIREVTLTGTLYSERKEANAILIKAIISKVF